jgi:Tfp pilus assembly protein PilF
MPRRTNKRQGKVDFAAKREAAMRPSRYLGYDHDRLGIYFLGREAHALAEAEFRRAVWLNPYEMEFHLHLAMCLFQQRKYREARDTVRQVLAEMPSHADALKLLHLVGARSDAGD